MNVLRLGVSANLDVIQISVKTKVPNNSAARLLFFKIFPTKTVLFGPTHLLKFRESSFSLFLLQLFQYCIFSCIFILLFVSRLKCLKFLPTRLLGPRILSNFKISSHLHCYLDSTLIQHLRVPRRLLLNKIVYNQ